LAYNRKGSMWRVKKECEEAHFVTHSWTSSIYYCKEPNLDSIEGSLARNHKKSQWW